MNKGKQVVSDDQIYEASFNPPGRQLAKTESGLKNHSDRILVGHEAEAKYGAQADWHAGTPSGMVTSFSFKFVMQLIMSDEIRVSTSPSREVRPRFQCCRKRLHQADSITYPRASLLRVILFSKRSESA